jgi:glutamate/tyrosine decarboxylase-like PLP-dependent enzyme
MSELFPAAELRLEGDNYLTGLLAEAAQRVAQGPVSPTLDIVALRQELAGFGFEEKLALRPLLEWTVARLECGVVHTTHPRYLGLFNPAPTFPAQCADRIAACFNPQLATATTSPAAVEIEAHVARSVARRAGLAENSVGHFTSGGSEANFTALVCALTRAAPAFATIGSRAFAGQPVFYISRDSHLAWIKIAHQAGIGRDAARLVATDGAGRMSLAALADAMAADRAQGCVPFMIAATAGTTNAGMIDPLAGCAELARRENIWLHVDAAWGGAAIASARLRGLLHGIEQADSVTIDAHKWFATTMGCGIFLTAHPQALSEAFNVSASFMPSHAPALDPYVTSAQWSRRFLGLRLFLSLGVAGWHGYAEHVERAVGLAQLLAAHARDRGWSVVNDPSLAVLCLAPPAGSPPVRDIVRRVVASGRAWVSVAAFEGRDIVRACITHGETSSDDVAAVADCLEQARTVLP